MQWEKMTTAAVKAAAATIKICFFMDRPRDGSELSMFNMERNPHHRPRGWYGRGRWY